MDHLLIIVLSHIYKAGGGEGEEDDNNIMIIPRCNAKLISVVLQMS